MKKKIISTIVLSAVLLCGCSEKEVKPTEAPAEETVTTEATEATSETTEAVETTEVTEETEPTEAEPETTVGFRIDSNLNFGCDAEDAFCINGKQVSMKEYFDTLNSDEIVRSTDAFSKFTNCQIQFIGEDEYTEESEFVKFIEHELEADGVEVGAESTDKVRIDEENNKTYYKVEIPQIELGTADCEKANKEIIEFVEDFDPWYGMVTVRYRFFEHEDGSKTFVIFYGDGSDDCMFKSFTFDADGKRMSADDIIKSAGWEPSEFEAKALEYMNTDLIYANEFDVYMMYGIVNSQAIDSLKDDPDLFVNENGNLVVITSVDFFGMNGSYMIPYAIEPDLTIPDSDEITENTVLAEQDWRTEMYSEIAERMKTEKFDENEECKIEDIDVATIADGMFGDSKIFGARFCSIAIGDESTTILAYLNERVTEDSEYKYEVYCDGELIKSDKFTVEAKPFFRQIETKFDLKTSKDKVYCVVLYDANGSENIIDVTWQMEKS